MCSCMFVLQFKSRICFMCVFYLKEHTGSRSSSLLLRPDFVYASPGSECVCGLTVSDEMREIRTHNRVIKSDGSPGNVIFMMLSKTKIWSQREISQQI